MIKMETTQAKIRNKLGPIWNIIAMISEFDNLPDNKKDLVWNLIKEAASNFSEQKEDLLNLIDSTSDENK
jgi:hypothetical protein